MYRATIVIVSLMMGLSLTGVSSAQGGSWTVSNPEAEVIDGTVALSVDVTRSFGIGELAWRQPSDQGDLFVSGGQNSVLIRQGGTTIDCPGATYSGTRLASREVITFAEGCISAGTYSLSVTATNVEGGDSSNTSEPVTLTTTGGAIPDVDHEPAEVTRLAGGSRYDTAVEVSRFLFPNNAARVTIVNADVQVDALPGSQLGGGPILYVPAEGEVPQVVLDEVARLNPREVVVLGGDLAVGEEVVDQVVAQTAHRVN